jgi:uncharacterized repeat protein (TIGR04138 family)
VDPQEKLYKVLDNDSRYPLPAYSAIHNGLDFTMKMKNVVGHVDGQELAVGMARYLKEEYGPFARMVLDGWGIQSTIDFGRIVFNLIEVKLMSRQEHDSIEDFMDVYNFDVVFSQDYDWLKDIRAELGLPVRNPGTSV